MTEEDDDKIIRFPHFERIDYNASVRPFSGLKYYVLVEHEPKVVDMMTWAMVCEQRSDDKWRVAFTEIGQAQISTVFLGLDHSFGGGPPLLFETMIFGGRLDEFQNRCSTWKQAEEMHAEAVAMVRAGHLKVIK